MREEMRSITRAVEQLSSLLADRLPTVRANSSTNANMPGTLAR